MGIECGGPQASAKMKRLAPAGARVTLRTDPTQDTIDRYGRLLAYVGGALEQTSVATASGVVGSNQGPVIDLRVCYQSADGTVTPFDGGNL